MAEPTTDTGSDGSYGASFGSMAADASRATKAYADVTREKIASEGRISGEMARRGEEDRTRALKAYEAQGIKPEEFKPWNAEAEHKKFESDPIAGFGSVGSVFAMIASAFTKAPMLSSIEGMAGALNGIKQGNEASYTRAYDSWKENVKVAKERHEIQHQAYTDALNLSTHDLALSGAKLRAEAARFGDKQLLALAENGMVKEIYDTIAARNRAMESASTLADNTTIRTMQQRMLKTSFEQIDAAKGPPGPDGQPTELPPAVKAAQKLNVMNTIMASGRMNQPQQMAMAQIIMQHPEWTIEKVLEEADKHNIIKQPGLGAGGVEKQAVMERARQIVEANPGMSLTEAIGQAKTEASVKRQQKVDEEKNAVMARAHEIQTQNPNMSLTEAIGQAKTESSKKRQEKYTDVALRDRAEQLLKEDPKLSRAEAIGRAATDMKPDSKSAAAVNMQKTVKRAEELQREDPDLSETEAFNKAKREMTVASSGPTGNRVDQLRSKIDQSDNAIKKSEKILAFLDKYKGGAGLIGKIMRGEEIASNIVGAGTQSDRVQFRRDVLDLQKILPEIMADHNGKVLKSDQDKIDAVVAGLASGDTGPNTKRAYRELIEDIKKRKKDFSARITTGFDPNKTSSGAGDSEETTPPPGKKPPDLDKLYPKVQ
jgi:hypothetical protein